MSWTRDEFVEALQTRFRSQANNTFQSGEYTEAINHAIRTAWPWFFQIKFDSTTCVICNDKLSYTLPSDLKKLCEVRLEPVNIKASGTATGTQSSTTLQDTGQSWTADVWNDDHAVAIVKGTGAGQQRTITDNDTDTLTVATWTTNPVDADSEYVIKDLASEFAPWDRLYHWRLENNAGVLTLRLPGQYTSGASLGIVYAAEYTKLSSGSSATELNPGYVLLSASNYLYGLWLSNMPEHSVENRQWAFQFTDQKLQEYVVLHCDQHPVVQITYPGGGGGSAQAGYPF